MKTITEILDEIAVEYGFTDRHDILEASMPREQDVVLNKAAEIYANQSRWVSVEDLVPEEKPFEMYTVLGFSEDRESEIVVLYQDKSFYNPNENYNFDGNPVEITGEITHWQPLPEKP